MVVFDITNAESFAKAKNWVKELQRQGNPNMIMALAGNKADLAAQRSVTADEAKVGCLVTGAYLAAVGDMSTLVLFARYPRCSMATTTPAHQQNLLLVHTQGQQQYLNIVLRGQKQPSNLARDLRHCNGLMQAYADENSLFFWETSAKTNVNVAEVFNDIAERLPRAAAAPPQQPTGGITLTEPAPEQKKKSSCCSTA